MSTFAAPLGLWLNNFLGTQQIVISCVIVTSLGLLLIAFLPDVTLGLSLFAIMGSIGLLSVLVPLYLVDEYFPYQHPSHVLTTSISMSASTLCKYLPLLFLGFMFAWFPVLMNYESKFINAVNKNVSVLRK